MTFLNTKTTTGIIIAGGLSSRFNIHESTHTHKALTLFKNMTLIDYVVSQLRPFCTEIFIVVNTMIVKSEFEKQIACIKNDNAIKVVIDQPFAGAGPLRGILTGFSYVRSQYIISLACDTLIHSDIVQVLLKYLEGNSSCQASTIFYENGIVEPTFFIINKKDADMILDILENTSRGRLTDLIRCLNQIAFFQLTNPIPNINFKHDLLELEEKNTDQNIPQVIKRYDVLNSASKIFIEFIDTCRTGNIEECKNLLRRELKSWDKTPFKQLILHTLSDIQKLLAENDPEMDSIKKRIQYLRELA